MAAPDPGLPAAPPGGAGQAGRAPPIVGLRREREVLTVALEAGRHVVIEGPPGTGKSTLLRDIARQAGRAVVFAEGNAELTPARLIGQYDPAQVLNEGYVPASFTDGPMRISPASGFSSPAIIRKSVVLPAPFGPMMPTMPPLGRLKFRLSNSRRSP